MKKSMTLIVICFIFVVFSITSVYGGEEHVIIQQDSTTVLPIFINKPGSYLLVTDIYVKISSVNAIRINCDSVSLDLGGHTITGDIIPPGPGRQGRPGHGIAAFNNNYIFIKNGKITTRNHGILIEGGIGHIVENITAVNNRGAGITTPRGSIIRNCISSNNTYGITASNSLVKNCVVNNNTLSGITAEPGALIHSCTAFGNNPDILKVSSGQLIQDCVYGTIQNYN